MYRVTLAFSSQPLTTIRHALQEKGYLVCEDNAPSSSTYPDILLTNSCDPATLQQLRATYTYCQPILLVVASHVEEAIIALEAGADDAVSAPYMLSELMARVALRLNRRIIPSHILRVGPLLVDTLRYIVLLYNQSVLLSPLEMNLLQVFIEAPGTTLSKSYLYQKVWKSVYMEGDRAVDTMVLRLRTKLGEMGTALETVRGQGYCLRT